MVQRFKLFQGQITTSINLNVIDLQLFIASRNKII